MDPSIILDNAKGECDEQFRIATCRRSIGLITDFQYVIDLMIALQNLRIQTVRIRFPQMHDHSAELSDVTFNAYRVISDAFPSVLPRVRPKALQRDWHVFDLVSKAFLDEWGWNGLRKRVQVVPREWRSRTWRERFTYHDELDYSASLKEVMQYHSTLPQFGSFKTIERQYAAAKKKIATFVYADTERGVLKRDPFYERLLHLNMMNVDFSKIEGPETV